MQVRILGPVEIEADDRRILRPVRRQERCVLAILALHAGQAVPVGRLVRLVWGDDPPEQARAFLRSHVARIRALLAGAGGPEQATAVRSRAGAYLLDVEPESVDLYRFRVLRQRADRATDEHRRASLLDEALGLWRGPALADAAPEELRRRLCAELDEEHLQAVEAALAAGLELGRHHDLLPRLARLTDEYPTRQRLVELHMLALYRDGRAADASRAYHDLRDRLADELGLDPAAGIQQLHQSILRDDVEPAAPVAAGPPNRTRPALLPAAVSAFAGRRNHLRHLDKLLDQATEAVVITAIAGTAGVGKTALAVHWAHSVRDRFPDGQLYLNLRGFDPTGMVMEPEEAVRRLLDGLQVPAASIPAGFDAQVDLYRSVVADRKMLILLDNARDSAQVRPLLPGAPDCLVLVTSRNQLTGLIAQVGAQLLPLDLLTVDEAEQLLARRLGAERTAAEPDSTADIIALCARLPLALALVAAHATVHPETSLGSLADQLRDTRHKWLALAGDDAATDVRAVFSWSYQALTAPAARLFRLLGLHPGPDVSAPAAASLAGVAPDEAGPLLMELRRANLLSEHVAGRYAFHDLLREYAGYLAGSLDPVPSREAATVRILDHYLHTAFAATQRLDRTRDPIALNPAAPGVTPERVADGEAALDWFAAEHAVLLATVHGAAAAERDTYTWQLAWSLWVFQGWQGHWYEMISTCRAAADAGRRLGAPTVEALAHRNMGYEYMRLSRYDDAETHLRKALDLTRRSGDANGQAHTHHRLSNVLWRRGHLVPALDEAQQALRLYLETGHRPGQGRALNSIGWYHAELGDLHRALATCQEALALQQSLGDTTGEATTLDSLGYIRQRMGHHAEAIACYEQSLAMRRKSGERYNETITLTNLGDAHAAAGDPVAADAAYQEALRILTELDNPDRDKVAAKIQELQQA